LTAATGPRKIRSYGSEFKTWAVKLSMLSGVRVQDVAEALDIHPFMLSRWRKEYREGRIKATAESPVGCSAILKQNRLMLQLLGAFAKF
jgi:transposase